MKRRISAALLTLCLLMSLMPTVAFAAPSGSFDDVDGHWGQAAVERWAGYGVVNGDGTGNFNPDNQMTRAEFATMLANMLGYKEKATNTFSDVNDSDWFADAILKLAAAGVIQGSNGMANPNAPISRQEAAVMMCRAFNIPTTGGSLDFADSADVADWAKGAVAALASRGMMNGVGGNNVAPLANINRASVATLLDNMITEYVTEDKTVSGEVKGIVLVAGNATVTFEDATLAENLIVAPKAEGAEVVLTGSTTAGDVYVDGTATVKVDSSATAGDVQVGAANSTVEVAGKADTVTVDSAAADTKVNVGKDATVGTVDVAGANTAVTVDGKVDNVNVSSSATGTDVVANSGATVGKVETAAKDVTVSGNGKVENVTATDGTVAVTTPNTNVTNKTDSADNVTNQGKPVPPENGGGTPTPTPPSGGGGGGGGGGTTSYDVTITVNKTGNGEVTADTGLQFNLTDEEKESGKAVELTFTPAEGYIVYEVKVGDKTKTLTDGKLTLSGVKVNTTVSVKFIQPITDVKLLVIDSVADYKALCTNYNFDGGNPDGTLTDADLAQNAWLAVGVKLNTVYKGDDGFAVPVDTNKIDLASLSFTLNGTSITPNVGLDAGKFGNAVSTYIRAHTDGGDSSAASLFARDKSAAEVSGTYSVAFTYKGIDYTASTDYAAIGDNGEPVEMVDVKFMDGSTEVQTYKVVKEQEITVPTLPSTDKIYYTGKWTYGDKTATSGGKLTVNDAMTLTTESVPVTATKLSVRMAGPETNHMPSLEDFNYPAAYTAAGISLDPATGKITVDAKKLIDMVGSSDETLSGYLTHIMGNEGKATQVMFGIAYETPSKDNVKATKLKFSNSLDFSSGTEVVLATDPKCHNSTLISYIPVAKVEGDPKVVTFLSQGDSDYCLWTDSSDNVIAVTKTVITIGTPTSMPEMTITVDGNTTGSVKVPYNTAITEAQLNSIKALAAKENYTVAALKNGETEVTTDTKFTADTKLTATYEAKANISVVTTNLVNDPKFGDVTVSDFQDITLGNGFSWNESKNRYEAAATGSLNNMTFEKFSSNEEEQTGYYAILKLDVPAEFKSTAKISYQNNAIDQAEYADGSLILITRMGASNVENFTNRGVKIDVDWDGNSGANAAATYVVNFSNVTATKATTPGT